MQRDFQVGDRVQGLDDALDAVITHIGPGIIRVKTVEGFELEVSPDGLVKIPKQINFNVPPGVSQTKEKVKRPKKVLSGRGKTKSTPVLEVDLHIEKLVTKPHLENTYEILDLQLEAARSQLNFAIRKRIQRVVFIHGVGEGVLKAELHTLLRRYDGIQFEDANYADYGYGATAVYIPQETLRLL
ncbi:MAG: hypothetical protein RLZZ241_799 [Bacteroidota bacterium]|jgi:dsDNA-specific endonuclease/ATPase MutS2